MWWAGRATRAELYGCLVVTAVILELMAERFVVDRMLIEDLLKRRKTPQIVQNNNQSVIVESEQTRLIRELAEKRGWIDGDVSTTKGSGQQPGK